MPLNLSNALEPALGDAARAADDALALVFQRLTELEAVQADPRLEAMVGPARTRLGTAVSELAQASKKHGIILERQRVARSLDVISGIEANLAAPASEDDEAPARYVVGEKLSPEAAATVRRELDAAHGNAHSWSLGGTVRGFPQHGHGEALDLNALADPHAERLGLARRGGE